MTRSERLLRHIAQVQKKYDAWSPISTEDSRFNSLQKLLASNKIYYSRRWHGYRVRSEGKGNAPSNYERGLETKS